MATSEPGLSAPYRLPEGFVLGAATAAYQVEGAVAEDGRGRSIWDVFSHVPGNVRGGDTGDVACDAYHRYEEDVALLAELGIGAYRFSIAWPRVLPEGRAPVNEKGLDYYRALVDALAARSILPVATLYHWDLPQALEEEGGWSSRAVAEAFAEYAAVVAEALGDRVARWITLNEPQVAVELGHRRGTHAPGVRDEARARRATHHLLLAHGLATEALRSVLPATTPVGVTLDLHPVRAGGPAHEEVAAVVDAEVNGCYLEPILHGRYPCIARREVVPGPEVVEDGDLEAIAAPIDFLGVNYYSPMYVRSDEGRPLAFGERRREGHPGVVTFSPVGLEQSAMGWPIDPDGLYGLLRRLAEEAPGLALVVTENGCAAEDYVNPEGRVVDVERVRYLHGHLEACARALRDGVPLRGYFAWSLLDNFEWACGYQKRFGIVYVDFGDQRRIVKESGRFYAKVAASRTVPPLPDR